MPRNLSRPRLVLVLTGILGSLGLSPARAEPASPASPKAVQAPKPGETEPEQGYLLRYKFRPDARLEYEVSHRMRIELKKKEISQTVLNESEARKHFRVVDVASDGTATLVSVIDHVEMTARSDNREPVEYDSSNPPPPAEFEKVHQTIGKPLVRVRVSPRGKMLSVERLLPEMLQRKLGSPGGKAATPDTAPSKNFLIVFPDDPVAVGETWKDDRLQVPVSVGRQLQKTVKLLRRYKLVSVRDGRARISLQTSVLTPVNDPHVRAQLIQRTPNGTILFDIDAGRIVRRTLELDKTEIGVFGGGSSMRAVSRRSERLIRVTDLADDEDRTASKSADSPR